MGEAGFVCPRCAEPMQHLSWGEYGCCCGERVYAAGHASDPPRAVAVPSSPAEVERWLRAYPAWLETLEGAGYYGVAPDMGTRIQSNRTGRPTERTALLFCALLAQCRTVEAWVASLSPLEREIAGTWLDNRKLTVIAQTAGIAYKIAWGIRSGMPLTIWSRFYNGMSCSNDSKGNTA